MIPPQPSTHFCGHCGAPAAAGATFCGRCGYPMGGVAAQFRSPAFVPATHQQAVAAHQHKSHLGLWVFLGIVGTAAMIAFGLIAYASTPQPQACTGGCPPPQVAPLTAPHTYTSSTYGYSLEWYDRTDTTLSTTVNNDRSVGWQLDQDPSYTWTFTGDSAAGRDAQSIVDSIQKSSYANASLVYTIPQAEIGYTPGYGNVYDLTVVPASGSSIHTRLFIMVAVKNDVAVEMVGIGKYKKQSYGHPNPSLSPAPFLFDATLNSVTWKGDPPL